MLSKGAHSLFTQQLPSWFSRESRKFKQTPGQEMDSDCSEEETNQKSSGTKVSNRALRWFFMDKYWISSGAKAEYDKRIGIAVKEDPAAKKNLSAGIRVMVLEECLKKASNEIKTEIKLDRRHYIEADTKRVEALKAQMTLKYELRNEDGRAR